MSRARQCKAPLVASRPLVDCAPPPRHVLRHVRRHAVVLHRAEPALPRRHHAAHAQERARRSAASLLSRRAPRPGCGLLLEGRIGQRFPGIVTGASEKGTWVRVLAPPVEGKLQRGWEGLDVRDRLQVQLLSTDVPRGFVDFAEWARNRRDPPFLLWAVKRCSLEAIIRRPCSSAQASRRGPGMRVAFPDVQVGIGSHWRGMTA